MTKKALTKLVGRTALWNPAARATGATLRVMVTIEGTRQTCGRAECQIVPNAGRGVAWVRRHTLKLAKPAPVNLY